VSPNQVNVQIPYETLAERPPRDRQSVRDITYSFNVTGSGPGIFTFSDGRVNPSRAGARGQL
jgi:uncharacterized protein (TIGR03437 family)